MFVGRREEWKELSRYFNADRSHFIALHGRRRVGKTFLIRSYFNNQFTFYCTGLLNGKKAQQLYNFLSSIRSQFDIEETQEINTWYDAFNLLIAVLKRQKEGKKVIFLDELPWMDTQGSDLLLGIEYFWNSWASARNDILLIVCGSSSSWMISKIFKNTGGLYNRVTGRIKVNPFTLVEVEEFFNSRNMHYSREQCIEAYMVFGGIPYYLDQFVAGYSPSQNIDSLCFGENAKFVNEFELLFKSLFNQYRTYIEVVKAIARKNKGLTREEISSETKLANGGNLTKVINHLEQSNFIRKYNFIGKKSKQSIYQLIDPYCLFVINMDSFMSTENYWLENLNTPKYHNWSGYAFEIVCLNHLNKIKNALGIAGVSTNVSTWSNANAQIDLIIERADKVVNLVEIKYAKTPFVITKKYDLDLRNKEAQIRTFIPVKSTIWPVIVAPYGLAQTPYKNYFLREITMEELF